MSDSGRIKEYYEEFADYLFRDRLYPNQRHNAIRTFLDRRLRPGDRVCEIGCGIGILTEHVARRVGDAGGVTAMDISESNIAIARRTAARPNITYRSGDVFEFDFGGERFDVILLCDVFEHIPEDSRARLGKRLGELLADEGRILITVPSPEYQRYLKEHAPEKLQVVDTEVTPDVILDLAAATGTVLHHWSYVDAFGKNQYVHVALLRETLYPRGTVRDPWWRRLWWKGFLYGPLANALRRRRYGSGGR